MTEPLFHLALPEDWQRAQARGTYDISTRGMTLAEVGFIHLSYAHQWPRVRAAFYGNVDGDLVLLEIAAEKVRSEIVVEVGNVQTGERFPHLYGPLPTSAVVTVTPLSPPHDRPPAAR